MAIVGLVDSVNKTIFYLFFKAAMAIHVIKKCLYPGITTSQLDDAAAEMAITMTTLHPDYGKLASRIAISNLHKQTKEKFSGKFC